MLRLASLLLLVLAFAPGGRSADARTGDGAAPTHGVQATAGPLAPAFDLASDARAPGTNGERLAESETDTPVAALPALPPAPTETSVPVRLATGVPVTAHAGLPTVPPPEA